ncbi:hypothetical protein ACRCPT_06705 [Pseudomonas aeruginosa]|jgi:hypothetical protein|uniref:hypothetical protein n=1 Tax=Ectopseudomonas guguanensis TaxID=1198456 RepID=UPI00285B5BA2|nr:hypothetical protein [Pseudomonas guguanensis]MDR8015312.1 hypothetical protein [Pseudomonas guguanensis]HCF2991441.1 hypothetical protein [Pseudomonas aeruginosa]
MNVLIEFLVFIFALPAIFLYLVFSTLRTIADFFGWTFIPGVLCMHLGVTLYALGQPDPSVPWETFIQRLAAINIAGISLPLALICAGSIFLVIGAVSHLRGQTTKKF